MNLLSNFLNLLIVFLRISLYVNASHNYLIMFNTFLSKPLEHFFLTRTNFLKRFSSTLNIQILINAIKSIKCFEVFSYL